MSNKGKKHKRGDRGSVEEENSVSIAKKQNMAANLDESSKEEGAIESEEEEEETSLEEIKSLLVGVQQTLLDMRTENRRMAAEIPELKSLKKSLNKALEDNGKLKKSVDSLKKKVEEQTATSMSYTANKMTSINTRVNTRLKYMVFQKICIMQRRTW